jgi:hypothetical protein
MTAPNSEDVALDNRIREGASDALPPPEVERHLHTQLAAFRSRFEGHEPAARPRIYPWRRLGIAGMAAVATAVVGLIIVRPRAGFAEVADAVLKQPWVHTRTTLGTDRRVWEDWYSPTKDIAAWRAPDSIRYEDYRLRVFDSYDPAEKVVYHGPVAWNSRGGHFESMAGALKVLLQDGRKPEHLGFLGTGGEQSKVIEQRSEKVTEQGRACVDIRLTVKGPESAQPMTMVFRVDAATLLPRSCRMEGHHDGKPVTRETQFDYPEKGPADIYDLGVPKDSKLVDRIPSGDLKRILETLRAGRERMGNYRVVFVTRYESFDHRWWTEWPQLFYRKGANFRRDFARGAPADLATTKRPADGEDLGKWWTERAKLFRFVPVYIQRGATGYHCKPKTVNDPDGSEHQEIVSVRKTYYNASPGEIYPVDWSMRPEFACRPPMGIGTMHMEPTLDLHPTEGPPGCILLSVRENRFWLDPKRDYIVMRWDTVVREGSSLKVIGRNETEEVARSPQGVWYAKRIRRSFPDRNGKNKPAGDVNYIYVDFDAELPDSLFDVPKPGRVY